MHLDVPCIQELEEPERARLVRLITSWSGIIGHTDEQLS